MASRIHLLAPTTVLKTPKFQNDPLVVISTGLGNRARRSQIPSAKKSLNDAELASDLAAEVAKINAHLAQKEEAMKKSRELLFTELCQSLDSKEEELHQKWMKMSEDEKWVLVKQFVNDWGSNFHPLSARSVKEMVEEYLQQQKPTSSSSTSDIFPGLKRMIGF